MRALLLLCLLALPAAADYALPAAREIHYLVVDDWKLEKEALVTPDERWRVDLLWLADRIDSNLICCGDYQSEMRKYLARLTGPLVAEMVRVEDEFFVASLRPLRQVAPKTTGGEAELRKRSAAARIAMDLRLEVARVGPRKVKRGEGVRVEVKLRNVSKKNTRRVVKPGDGSESGWREPHVFFSARHGDAKVDANGIGRCGNFDSDWHKDTMDLKPGASITLHDWLPPVSALFRFEKDGVYRIRVHYRYMGGKGGAGPMGDTPAFEIVSQPIEIEIEG